MEARGLTKSVKKVLGYINGVFRYAKPMRGLNSTLLSNSPTCWRRSHPTSPSRPYRRRNARLLHRPSEAERRQYSPDLNPIEKLFAKLKHWLRKAAAQTPDAVCDAIGRILETVTSAECTNYPRRG